MHLYDYLRLIQGVSLLLWAFWLWTYLFLDVRHTRTGRLMRRYFFEVRPFIPIIATIHFLAGGLRSGAENAGFRIIVLAFVLAVWWIARHEDDDDERWKKRLDGLHSRIVQIGAKLRIVPA